MASHPPSLNANIFSSNAIIFNDQWNSDNKFSTEHGFLFGKNNQVNTLLLDIGLIVSGQTNFPISCGIDKEIKFISYTSPE